MNRKSDFFESTDGSRSEKDLPLVRILVDMVRSALTWEEQHGMPGNTESASDALRTPSPLKYSGLKTDTESEEGSDI